MTTHSSPHFTPVDLAAAFNASRPDLPAPLRTPARFLDLHGEQTIRGMPFLFGDAEVPNVVLLEDREVAVDLGGATATYVLFVHAAEDDGPEPVSPGSRLGDLVSEYELVYEDGSEASHPVLRRFAIQQARINGHVASFACVPAVDPVVVTPPEEAQALKRPRRPIDMMPTRVLAPQALGTMLLGFADGFPWIYALENPHPEVPLRAVVARPREERSALYAVTLTDVVEHPLRPGTRRKLRLSLPEGVTLNAIGEVDESQIGIDLGVVMSARPVLDYDADRWLGDEAVVEPARSAGEVIVEYAAHPQAQLHLGNEVVDLGGDGLEAVEVATAERPVQLRFVDSDSGEAVAVRLHVHGADGEYLPPRGHLRKVNRMFLQDIYADFANVDNQYAYVDGECVVDLPLGTVYVEITRGYEIAPVRTAVEVGPETHELVFELGRVLRWREQGWVTADTHVHFLSPQTALLEGRAEGVNVVNVLASQWGEIFTNVGDFDGRTTVGADDLGGRGEFLVRVGSENRMSTLGHISLLGYGGPLIHPLCSGGPDESAFGDPLEVTMAEWAQRCRDQGGLVVLPHCSGGRIEYAADIVLGVIDAVELMEFNPLKASRGSPLNTYGIAEWYRYLNLGYHVPVVAGTDKMNAETLLGGVRTYVQLGERDFTYEHWMDAIRAGNTFVTAGPLTSMTVEGVSPGGQVELPAGGGTVQVEWQVESLRMPLHQIEVVVGGVVAEEINVGGELAARGTTEVSVATSTWIAVRVRGSYHGRPEDVAAHTSAVQVLVDGGEILSEVDSMTVLDQIQGALAYVDTIAPRAEDRRFKQLRATLETAYERLHQRMHAAGQYHRHPLHDPAQPHEH